jgi:hypothetical protein
MITPVIKTLGIRLQTNVSEITPFTTYLQEYSTGILQWSTTENHVKLLQINDDKNFIALLSIILMYLVLNGVPVTL